MKFSFMIFSSEFLLDIDLDTEILQLLYKLLNIHSLKLDLAEDFLALKSTNKTVLCASWRQQCWLKLSVCWLKLSVLKWLFSNSLKTNKQKKVMTLWRRAEYKAEWPSSFWMSEASWQDFQGSRLKDVWKGIWEACLGTRLCLVQLQPK